jgi:hypothetical protein
VTHKGAPLHFRAKIQHQDPVVNSFNPFYDILFTNLANGHPRSFFLSTNFANLANGHPRSFFLSTNLPSGHPRSLFCPRIYLVGIRAHFLLSTNFTNFTNGICILFLLFSFLSFVSNGYGGRGWGGGGKKMDVPLMWHIPNWIKMKNYSFTPFGVNVCFHGGFYS